MERISYQQYMTDFNAPLGSLSVGHFRKNPECRLAGLCDLYGSDKGSLKDTGHAYPWPPHNYTEYYARLFGHCRPHIRKVFECGLGTNNLTVPSNMGAAGKPGASLRVWRDYFPNAQIYGGDIDPGVLFSEERISTYYLDQTNPNSIGAVWGVIGESGFDLIIDDGLHTFEAGLCLFQHSVQHLAEGGVYIIEDVWPDDLAKFRAYFQTQPFAVDYINLIRPGLDLGDNNLVVIRKG